jgi:hypothetical protein
MERQVENRICLAKMRYILAVLVGHIIMLYVLLDFLRVPYPHPWIITASSFMVWLVNGNSILLASLGTQDRRELAQLRGSPIDPKNSPQLLK